MTSANCGLIKMDNLFRNVCLRSDTLCRNNPKGQRIAKAVSHFSYTCKTVQQVILAEVLPAFTEPENTKIKASGIFI